MPTVPEKETAKPKANHMVIAPDIILDLVLGREPYASDAARLFDAIATDNEAGVTTRQAYIASTTLPSVYARVLNRAGLGAARTVGHHLMQLLLVAPTDNHDYFEAVGLSSGFELEEAMQFVTCNRVGAKYLVTREHFGVKRTPVHRRTAAEMLPFFQK